MSQLPRHLRYQFRGEMRLGLIEFRYWAEGRDGAVEFWVRESFESFKAGFEGERDWYGGFELHSLQPTGDTPPDHARCPMLSDRACWYDGSSSYATETWIPRWQRWGGPQCDPREMWSYLAVEYASRFEQQPEEVTT